MEGWRERRRIERWRTGVEKSRSFVAEGGEKETEGMGLEGLNECTHTTERGLGTERSGHELFILGEGGI
jgi:hypothetical protein